MRTFAGITIIVLYTTCFPTVLGYTFDKRSCVDMHPIMESELESDLKETMTTTETVSKSSGTGKSKTEISESLEMSLEPSPYNITLNSNKYRRSRTMTARIEGPEFNGIFIQVRNFEREASLDRSLLGTFDASSEIATLDCNSSHSDFYVANTAYSKNDKSKKDLVVKWTAPPKDVGSVQFTATIIQGKRYWTPVKSQPLLFNEFPPDLQGCGKDRSCYRYSTIERDCSNGVCNYVVVSQVIKDDVIFVMGGKVDSDTGYLGIGFTKDDHKLTFLDMCVCMKTGKQTAKAAHYMMLKSGSKPVRETLVDDTETDVDGDFIWCKFRRPLNIPNSNFVDLTKNVFKVFIWGELDSNFSDPLLPKENEMIRVTEPWNHTRTMNVMHYVGGGGSILKISWTIIFGVLFATVLELIRL